MVGCFCKCFKICYFEFILQRLYLWVSDVTLEEGLPFLVRSVFVSARNPRYWTMTVVCVCGVCRFLRFRVPGPCGNVNLNLKCPWLQFLEKNLNFPTSKTDIDKLLVSYVGGD